MNFKKMLFLSVMSLMNVIFCEDENPKNGEEVGLSHIILDKVSLNFGCTNFFNQSSYDNSSSFGISFHLVYIKGSILFDSCKYNNL